MEILTSDEIHFTTRHAKIHLYLESVLSLGKMSDHPEANARWENQLEEFQSTNFYREFGGINGEPIEFEWKFSQNSLDVDVQRRRLDKENCEECLSNSEKVKICAKKKGFRVDSGHSSAKEKTKNGMERTRTKLRENGIQRLLSCRKCQRKPTADIPRQQCVKSRSLEKERWKMYESVDCGINQYRTLVSLKSLSQSAQYPPCCSELV